jgi:hypothetical protein
LAMVTKGSGGGSSGKKKPATATIVVNFHTDNSWFGHRNFRKFREWLDQQQPVLAKSGLAADESKTVPYRTNLVNSYVDLGEGRCLMAAANFVLLPHQRVKVGEFSNCLTSGFTIKELIAVLERKPCNPFVVRHRHDLVNSHLLLLKQTEGFFVLRLFHIESDQHHFAVLNANRRLIMDRRESAAVYEEEDLATPESATAVFTKLGYAGGLSAVAEIRVKLSM